MMPWWNDAIPTYAKATLVMIAVWHVKYRAASESIIGISHQRVTDIIMYKEAREFIDPWHIYRTFAFRVNKRVMVTSE